MKKKKTTAHHNRQYVATTRTTKKVIKGQPQIRDFFGQLSDEALALQQVHLSCRVLFQKYGKGLDTSELSQRIRRNLIGKLDGTKTSQTTARNINKNFVYLKDYDLLPTVSWDGKFQVTDILSKHLPPAMTIALSKVGSEHYPHLTESEIQATISYLELLRDIVQKPERFFAKSVKVLRNKNSLVRRLMGSGKSFEVLKELWRHEGYDWESIDPESHDKLVDKLDDAFKNEK